MKMEDIARLAGVSKSAVSLALSGKPGIGAETRTRIVQIAEQNGYRLRTRAEGSEPDGSSLRFLAFTNSGIVLEEYYKQPFFMELIHHIEEKCRSLGYSLLFSSVDIGRFEQEIGPILDEPKAGVILLGTNLTREQIALIADRQPHLVVLDTCFETLPVHFVVMNNVMGAYQAASHLLDLGHRRIGYVQSSSRMHNFDARRRGFALALEERGLSIDGCRAFAMSPSILSSQPAFVRQVEDCRAQDGALPTAVFCECDYMAISAMKSFAELGIRVPDDIAVVGFDNIAESVIVTPELATVHVEKEKMAQLAVELLAQSIREEVPYTMKAVVDTRFIARGSCMPPTGAATE